MTHLTISQQSGQTKQLPVWLFLLYQIISAAVFWRSILDGHQTEAVAEAQNL
jgi:hypothetical protein